MKKPKYYWELLMGISMVFLGLSLIGEGLAMMNIMIGAYLMFGIIPFGITLIGFLICYLKGW